jgi:hypothetical protein
LNISFEFQFHNGLSGLIGHPVLRHVGVAIKRGRGHVIMNTQQRMGMFRHVLRLILNYKAAKQENVSSTEHIHIVHVSYYHKQYLIKMKSKNLLNGTRPHWKCEFLSKNNIVKPVYKGHSREPENVAFMSSYHLYTVIICTIHLRGI